MFRLAGLPGLSVLQNLGSQLSFSVHGGAFRALGLGFRVGVG